VRQQESDDYVVLQVSPERDPDGSKLSGTLNAQLALERARGLRELMLQLLGVLSLPLGVIFLLAHASSAPGPVRALLLAGWTAGVAGLAIAGASEWKYRRRRAALLNELGKVAKLG
jgi:hypothetical protein